MCYRKIINKKEIGAKMMQVQLQPLKQLASESSHSDLVMNFFFPNPSNQRPRKVNQTLPTQPTQRSSDLKNKNQALINKEMVIDQGIQGIAFEPTDRTLLELKQAI